MILFNKDYSMPWMSPFYDEFITFSKIPREFKWFTGYIMRPIYYPEVWPANFAKFLFKCILASAKAKINFALATAPSMGSRCNFSVNIDLLIP